MRRSVLGLGRAGGFIAFLLVLPPDCPYSVVTQAAGSALASGRQGLAGLVERVTEAVRAVCAAAGQDDELRVDVELLVRLTVAGHAILLISALAASNWLTRSSRFMPELK